MKDVQENRRSMARAVKASLEKYVGRVATIPAFARAKTDLSNLLATIDGLEMVQTLDRTGVTTDKQAAEDTAVEAVVKACKRATNYATSVGDNAFKTAISCSESSLKNIRDTSVKTNLENKRNLLQQRLADLADFGVTAAQIDDITSKIAIYDALIPATRSGTNEQSTATEGLVDAFKQLTVIIATVKRFGESFKGEDNEFVNHLTSALIIVDTGNRSGKDDGADGGETGGTKDNGTKQ